MNHSRSLAVLALLVPLGGCAADPEPHGVAVAPTVYLFPESVAGPIEFAEAPRVAQLEVAAKQAFHELRYPEAQSFTSQLLELRPDDPLARDLKRRLDHLLRPSDVSIAAGVDVVRIACGKPPQAVRGEREVRRLAAEAADLLARGDEDGAAEACERAKEVVRWWPYRIDTEADKQVDEVLDELWPAPNHRR